MRLELGKLKIASIVLLIIILLFIQPTVRKAEAVEATTENRLITTKYQYTDPFSDNLSGHYFISAPDRIMVGSPILIDFNVDDLTRTQDTMSMMKVVLNLGSGVVPSTKRASFSSCTTVNYDEEIETDTITIKRINEDSKQIETDNGLSLGLSVILEVASMEDAWVDLSLYNDSGELLYEYKYDLSDVIAEGQDTYTYTQPIGNLNLCTILVGPFNSDMDQYIQLFETGETDNILNIQTSGDIVVDITGDVRGPHSNPDIYSNDSGQTLYYNSSLPVKLGENGGEVRITKETELDLLLNDNGDKVDGGYKAQSVGFYLVKGDVTLSDYLLPTAIPTVTPMITESPVTPTELSVFNQVKPSSNNSVLPLVGIIAGIIIAVSVGGLALFLGTNMGDLKEIISLLKENPTMLNDANTELTSSAKVETVENKNIKRIKYPFLYIKFRKYTYILGQKEANDGSRLIRKLKLKYKSQDKLIVDLTIDMQNTAFKFYRIRHPRKAMRHKKDISITYLNNKEILEQDHFNSMFDFVNIKIIEK